MIEPPSDIEQVVREAWRAIQEIPGFLGEDEARFLGYLAACIPARGAIVEIGSFKGRSTVMLAKVASHYGLGPVVSIDPHTHNLSTGSDFSTLPSTRDEFLASLKTAGVESHVEVHVAHSREVSSSWLRPVRLLWIDGDHSYEGARGDFSGFSPFLCPGGVVAIHDALSNFPGPIRVFVEDVLSSDVFGPAGFVHSIAWSQLRPSDRRPYAAEKRRLAQTASRLIPFVQRNAELHGWAKIKYKLLRSRVPRKPISARELATVLGSPS